MTKLTLLAAAAAVLISSPVTAQERAHERRIPHRPDRPVSCYSFFFAHVMFVFRAALCNSVCQYVYIIHNTNNTPIIILHSRVYEKW